MEQGRHVAAALDAGWRDFLAHRWEVPATASSGQWRTALTERGASERAATELAKLAEDIHYLRYAPQLSSSEALQGELVQRSRRILKSLH